MEKIFGYLVLWRGTVMRNSARENLSRSEFGRLFVHGRSATIWPSRESALAAKRRAIKAWGRKDKPSDWWTIAVRGPAK